MFHPIHRISITVAAWMDEFNNASVACATVIMDVNGQATVSVTIPGNYWIKITHQNALQTGVLVR